VLVPLPAGVSVVEVLPLPAGVSAGVVVVAGVSAGVMVVAGVDAGETVSVGEGLPPPAPPSPSFGWQAASVVIKPSRTRTKTFVFTVNILTFLIFRLLSYPYRNVDFISRRKERTFWRILYH
jgi:hypothetical protein